MTLNDWTPIKYQNCRICLDICNDLYRRLTTAGCDDLGMDRGMLNMRDVILSRASLRTVELPVYQGISIDDVRLVNSEKLACAALEVLMTADVIGFDTESKPTFLKGEISTGPHIIQLATETHAYLFQVAQLHSIEALKAILESPRILKVGFGLGGDRSALRARLDIELNHVLDLGEVLRGSGHRGTVGAKVAVAHFFGHKLHKSKKIGTSNWASSQLTERQKLYAANDAHVALRVYRAWARTDSAALNDQRGY